MKIGVLGDTHNNLRSVDRIVELFNAARVERVIHTGDITQAKVLDALGRLDAPVHGVYGNNDLERPGLAEAARARRMVLVDPPLEITWHERSILVVHDPRELDVHLTGEHQLALHGHTHLHRHERVQSTWVFNPGECAGMLPDLNAVGVVDLASLECELLRF
jgi:hypothetical protein